MLQEAGTVVLDLQYFPTINWFRDSFHLGQFVFYPALPFKKSGFSNRLLIPASGSLVTLSIPISGGRGIDLPYKEVKIDYIKAWQRDHIRTLDTVYGGSPFYFQYKEDLHRLFKSQKSHLYDWNYSCLLWVMEKLKSNLPVSESLIQAGNLDYQGPIVEKFKPSNYSSPENGPFLKYPQVFEDKVGFMKNMSVLDLLFNVGPLKAKQMLTQE